LRFGLAIAVLGRKTQKKPVWVGLRWGAAQTGFAVVGARFRKGKCQGVAAAKALPGNSVFRLRHYSGDAILWFTNGKEVARDIFKDSRFMGRIKNEQVLFFGEKLMNHYIILGAVLVVLLLLATACAPNRPYRTSFEPFTGTAADAGTNKANHAVIETTADYSLGFVEFDEEGWFWDEKQVKAVEEMIRKEANISGTNNPAGIILLVFVHGWKNNAAYDCGNVATFRTALQQLKSAEEEDAKQNNRPARKMVGVFCGWRGLSWTVPYVQDLTFWNRKATAHKVGGYGAMTRLFVELEQLQELSNATILTNGPQTEFIIVGHSFGGAAVYSAISEFVTERFVKNVQEKDKPLKPLGDQVILLNPAFEASRHYNLNQLAKEIKQYPAAQRPVLSIFTSEGDWATHYALPAGRFVATMFENFRNANQRHATRDAVGWFGPFVTHALEYNTNAVLGGTAPTTTYNPQTKKHVLDRTNTARMGKSIENTRNQRRKWVANNPPQTYEFDDCILAPRGTFKDGDPFLVVAVDKHIMKDHDDIDNPVLINFLREYIQFCHAGTNANSKPK
jgi:hypothetical protein